MTVPVHPIQTPCCHRGGQAPQAVTLLAYEVYCAIYGPQPAMVEGTCRGGFSLGEIMAFLYARNFPRAEWSARTEEALRGFKMGR